jgi:hypothetical protein
MGIGIKANRKKIGALLAYLSFRMSNVELRKLLKITYLIDELDCRRLACSFLYWF